MEESRKKMKPIPILALLAIGILVIFLIIAAGFIFKNIEKNPVLITPPASAPVKSEWKPVEGMKEMWENEAEGLVRIELDSTFTKPHRLYGDPNWANLIGRKEIWEKNFPEKKVYGAIDIMWCQVEGTKKFIVCGLMVHYELRPKK